jgi:hypothetical protein
LGRLFSLGSFLITKGALINFFGGGVLFQEKGNVFTLTKNGLGYIFSQNSSGHPDRFIANAASVWVSADGWWTSRRRVQGLVGVGVGHRQVVLHNACDIEKGLGVWTKTAFLLSISQLVAFFSKHGIFLVSDPLCLSSSLALHFFQLFFLDPPPPC